MIEQVPVRQLAQWLKEVSASGRHALLLDVRENDELKVAALQPQSVAAAGATLSHIPMSELTSRIAELDPEQPVACLCHHGARSQRVALYLAQQGFEQVINIEGGIDAWSREIDPQIPRY
jgi:rhodanese-related sulfurtransferase